MFNPAEITGNYAEIGVKKASYPIWRLLMMGALAGFTIGMGGAVANTTTFAFTMNPSAQRIIAGLLFPFGLGIIMLTGMELFTGNCMIVISVVEKKVKIPAMLRNWLFVYLGNFIGALALSLAHVYAGQTGLGGGALAVYTIKTAAYKCDLSFGSALVLGILCNIMVCIGVLTSMSAKDTAGRIIGAFIPIAFFVICGYEHSIANMYYIPAGLLANSVPEYSLLAAETGVHAEGLTWIRFVCANLLPVTLGNIIGGAGVGLIMWAGHLRKH